MARRVWLLVLALVAAVTTPGAQVQEPAPTAETLVRHVRQALGRGHLDRARTMVRTVTAPAETSAIASSLVDIFEGKTAEARARLTPLAQAGAPDALLELGLLDVRDGRRTSGRALLARLQSQTFDLTGENLLRLARAAAALGDVQAANRFFQRVGDVPLQQAYKETAWGDMLLERHQAGEAVRSYTAAIDADPAWVGAHLGLARALQDEEPERAAASLETATTLAPAHPDVQLLIAERRLLVEDKVGALAALDKVVAVRAGSPEEVAWRAALDYANGEFAAADARVSGVVERNPSYTYGWRVLGGQAARAYRFADAAMYARKAVALDAEDPAAHADLGLYLMRTGDEAEARRELERAFTLDPYDVVTYNLLMLLDTIDSFVRVEHGPFVFKFPKAEADVLKPYALPLADEAFKTFETRYGFTPQGPILVEIFGKHDDFAVRTMGLPGLVGALGACFGRVIAMNSPMTMRASSVSDFSWQATLWHEIAHVFSLQASDYKVPRWLTEGISVYEEHKKDRAWGRELALEYARALATKRTFGVKGLPKAFERPRDLAMAYFEASLLTEYLISINGDAGVRALLAAYAKGAKDEAAFAQAFGKSVDDVEAGFQAFVTQQYGALARAMAPVDMPAGDAATAEALRAVVAKTPENYVAQWSLGQALLRAGDAEAAKAALTKAATLAPMAQGDASPRALLASIAEKAGDATTAVQEYRALLEWDHDNVEAARRMREAARLAGDVAGGIFALRVIANVDPFDATAHVALGQHALTQKDFQAALIELQAALALGPPNLAEAHADVAEALLGLGRRDEARRAALKALEQAPTYARAQDLLLAAMGGR
jgi:tetratricopeptide (TPR) repeat protein